MTGWLIQRTIAMLGLIEDDKFMIYNSDTPEN